MTSGKSSIQQWEQRRRRPAKPGCLAAFGETARGGLQLTVGGGVRCGGGGEPFPLSLLT